MLQEKLQTIVPAKEEAGESWASFDSAHKPGSVPAKFNNMPPGYDATSAKDRFGHDFGGEGDESGGVNPQSLRKGFERKQMGAADPQYTGEQCEQFYGVPISDSGKEAFAERNNYLDRI